MEDSARMHPNLLALAGPLAGRHFVLEAPETTIGRVDENALPVDDPSVSRRHCVVVRDGGEFLVRDLHSHNGTFVNGIPVEERRLEHGDRIEIGDTAFLFRVNEEVPSGANTIRLEPGSFGPVTRFELKSPWALEVAVLLKVNATVASLQNLYRSRGAPAFEPLSRQLFELFFDILHADSGAVLLANEDGGVDPFCAWDRTSESEFVADSNLVAEALSKGEPLAAGNALAVPMILTDRAIGVLYFATHDRERQFVDREVQVLTALAGIAALAIHHAREIEFLEAQNRALRTEATAEHSMVGDSAVMRKLYAMISRVSQGSSTVLIRGESGTGKELVARAIHQNSPRAMKPFIAINCAAVTETLLESEFFGHEKGSFTGAIAQKKGKLEVANGGTVFLDEIGELAPGLQAKLLRVLQEHEFERVGGTRPMKVDIRVVAATNRDLEAAIREGSFRQDLYYRLAVVTLDMPPLRERREDIPLLAAFFAHKFAKQVGRHVLGLSDRARACMLAYDWPGNVRELENAIERAVVLGSTDMILAEDLPDAIVDAQSERSLTSSFHDAVRDVKRQLILNALEQAKGNFTEAAKLLDLHPNYLHRLATQLELRKK